jgi:hypothetical protein
MWNRDDHKTSVRHIDALALVNRRVTQEELRAHQERRNARIAQALASAEDEVHRESVVERALRWLPMIAGGRR